MIFLGSVILLVHLLGAFAVGEPTAIVETSSGPVQGEILMTVHSTQYAAFKGIRYAQPPVGVLRFMPPMPVEPWNRTHQALQYGNKCPQLGVDSKVIGDEDCLFLNVFTPTTNLRETPTNLKPVMVWIHEGTFADGSGDVSIKRPDFLLKKDVLFVSMNYRLGALGFLSLDQLNVTGNQGLKDQNCALKWVQTNIAKFGGNPNKVTIFGKSAGAASVGFHVLSRASEGLFHGAISMSGTPLAPHSFVSLSEAARRGEKLRNLSTKWSFTRPLMALRNVSPETLLKKAHFVDPIAPFVPTIENSSEAHRPFLFEDVMNIYESGNFNKVPQILGSTNSDIIVYCNFINQTIMANINSFSRHVDRRSLNDAILRCFGDRRSVSSFRTEATEADPETDISTLFYNPVSETRRLLVENNGGNPVFGYDFIFPSYDDSVSAPETFGRHININNAVFTEDLDNIFYIPSKNPYPSANPAINGMIDRVCELWTDFAKYGDPTPDRGDRDVGYWCWPACDPDDVTKTLQIQPNMSMRTAVEPKLIIYIDHARTGMVLGYFFES